MLVVHTPGQTDQASSLCDLLELALSLPDGAITCSSLPGYALRHTAPGIEEWSAAVNAAGAVIALVDDEALCNPQYLFELASAACLNKRLVLLLERETDREALPWQLERTPTVRRNDRAALVSMVEDLGFQLDVAPRLGDDMQAVVQQLLQDAPSGANGRGSAFPGSDGVELVSPRGEFFDDGSSETTTRTVSPSGTPLPLESDPPLLAEPFDDAEELVSDDDFIALEDDELSEIPEDFLGEDAESRLSEAPPDIASAELCLEAGRAISECSFHREEGGDFGTELDDPFGRFVNAVGGNWEELKRIDDVDVWLGATDNLLQTLPPDTRHLSDWFELGFQFTTLTSIAEQGLPDDPEQRAAYHEIWRQSMAQFQRSAEGARLRHADVTQMQFLLESLITPEGKRDYSTIPRSLETLRNYAVMADR